MKALNESLNEQLGSINEGRMSLVDKNVLKFREGDTEVVQIEIKNPNRIYTLYNSETGVCNVISTSDVKALAANFGQAGIGMQIVDLAPGEQFRYRYAPGAYNLWTRIL